MIELLPEPSPADDGDRKVLDDVARHGWHVTKIAADATTAGWAFTTGLARRFGHPEIAIFGLRPDAMHAILNLAAEQVREGAALPIGADVPDLIEGYACRLATVAPRWLQPFFGVAVWYYRGAPVPFVQCLWPDRHGRFPWEAGCAAAVAARQPLLWEAASDAARAAPWLRSMGMPD